MEQPASPPAAPKTEPAAKPAAPLPQSTAPAPAAADPPPAANTPGEPDSVQSIAFGDWLLACAPARGKQVCALSQTVRDAQSRRLIQLTARRAAQASYIDLLVPVGVSIPYGVSIVLSDTLKIPAPLVDCGIDACRAVLALDAKTLQHIKAAKSLAVTFQDSKSGKVISISGSPKGFD
ncbi:MAG: invasion associated locus B family protein [Hyphomicrobium sp.]